MPLFLAKELLYSQNEFKRTKWGGEKNKNPKACQKQEGKWPTWVSENDVIRTSFSGKWWVPNQTFTFPKTDMLTSLPLP
jgi:hypothetical protein